MQHELYVGADGSETLQRYVLSLFYDMHTFNVLDKSTATLKDPLVRVFSRKDDDGMELALELARGFVEIFKGTFFYAEWIYKDVGVYFNATSSSNDTEGNASLLAWRCREIVKSREDKPPTSNAIKALLYLLQPGCEVERDWLRGVGVYDSRLESFQLQSNDIANTSGFTGGDSNRCFQKFMVRYTNYNRTTYEMLADYLGKYLFQEVSVYSYCLAITRADSDERDDWIKWAENGLKAILKQMLDALEIFDEPRPTQSTALSTIALPMASKSTVFEDRIAVLEQAKDSVLASEGITGSMAWVQRAERHQAIAKNIYQNLTDAHNASYGAWFQVLISLVQDKEENDMQCMDSDSRRHIKSFKSNGVSYFVQYFHKVDLTVGFNETWKNVQDKSTDILDALFSSKAQIVCKDAKEEIEKAVDKKVFGLKDGFSGLAIVRCGRRFVWYQLGYRYFAVGRTAGRTFMLSFGNGETYNSNCGQIFLFP